MPRWETRLTAHVNVYDAGVVAMSIDKQLNIAWRDALQWSAAHEALIRGSCILASDHRPGQLDQGPTRKFTMRGRAFAQYFTVYRLPDRKKNHRLI